MGCSRHNYLYPRANMAAGVGRFLAEQHLGSVRECWGQLVDVIQ